MKISQGGPDFDTDIAKFTPRQMEAVRLLDSGKIKFLLYGGALGGGKSRFLRWWALRRLYILAKEWGLRQPVGMLACEDYPSLKDRQLSKIDREFPLWFGKTHQDHKSYGRCFIIHPNWGGGVLVFRNLDDPSKYASSEFVFTCIDELTKNTYEVFDHVRTRARWSNPMLPDVECQFVAGTNPGSIGHCVPHGDVLTPDGWRDIKTLSVGDRVYTVLPNKELSETIISQFHRSYYKGEICRVEGKGLSISCTPNHLIAKLSGTRNGLNTRDKSKKREFSLVQFDELPGQATLLRSVYWGRNREMAGNDNFKVPSYPTRKRRIKQPKEITSRQHASLLGWMLTEGCTVDRDKAFCIAQTKAKTKGMIRDLLTECGFKFGETEKGFNVYAPDWWAYFRQFGKCREKFIPKDVKNSPIPELWNIFNAMIYGDGVYNVRCVSGQFYSFSKKLADDLSEIAVKLGFIVSQAARQRPNRQGLEYRVDFKRTKYGGSEILTGNHRYLVSTKTKRKSKVWREQFDGEVYCVGIENTHSFVIRQNGSVWVSGNSWVKQLWMDKLLPPEFEKYRDQFAYVPSKATDNPYLDESYWAMLDTLAPSLRKAFKDGDWNIFLGQAFPELTRVSHTCEALPIPRGAHIYSTFDWGFGAPFSFGWWWVDGDGRIYRFHEWYGWNGQPNQGLRLSDEELAVKATQVERRIMPDWVEPALIQRLAGHDIFQKKPDYKGGGQGPSTAETFAEVGNKERWPFIWRVGDPSRTLKIRQFHERLRTRDHGGNPIRPMLQVYPGCDHFFRTIGGLIQDEHNIEDIDTTGEDHVFDESCLICMARPLVLPESKPKLSVTDKRIDRLMEGIRGTHEEVATVDQHLEMRRLESGRDNWDGWDAEEGMGGEGQSEGRDGRLVSTV